MISKNVDIVAVFALLVGIFIWSEIRQSVWVQIMKGRPLRVEQISVRVPEPPPVPIIFK